MKNRPSLGALVVFALGSVGSLTAQGPDLQNSDKAYLLPPFILEEAAGPAWRYAEVPGHEILSRCNDAETKQLVFAFQRANRLLGLMLPAKFQIALDLPKALIFYDEELWPVAKQEQVAAMLTLHPPSRPVEPEETKPHRDSAFDVMEPLPGQRPTVFKPKNENAASSFFGNMCLSDTDSITTFAIISRASIDAQDTYLTPAYVETLLDRRTPQLPAWFRKGFLRLYGKLKAHDGTLTIMRASSWRVTSAVSDNFSVSPNRKVIKSKIQDKTSITMQPGYWGATSAASLSQTMANVILPIEAVLNERAPGGMDESLWLAEIELFVRWGIDPANPSRVSAFWKFVQRSVSEPLTEALFQECFDLSFAQATVQLTSYLPQADQLAWRLPETWKPSSFQLRNAEPGEICRIKGEWERLETRYVRRKLPALERSFLAQARKTLLRGYDRGDRDPRLLASLGLLELDADDSRKAREYFEAAPDKTVVRARANFELARLRYAETDGRSKRNDGKISGEQADFVIEPLLVACRQSPAIPQVYELLADVYVNCVAPPPALAKAALDEGVKFFPKDGELVYRVAALYSASEPREALRLVSLGLLNTATDSDKIRFLDLKKKLPSDGGGH